MEVVMFSFRRAISGLFSDLHKKVLQIFAAPWADGWVRATPNHVFDIYLSNIVFYDMHSTICFLCDLADKFLKAVRYAHDIPNLKIRLDTIYLRVTYLEENRSFIS